LLRSEALRPCRTLPARRSESHASSVMPCIPTAPLPLISRICFPSGLVTRIRSQPSPSRKIWMPESPSAELISMKISAADRGRRDDEQDRYLSHDTSSNTCSDGNWPHRGRRP
jgi:hypothetical protein